MESKKKTGMPKTCEAHIALELIRGRWTLMILHHLRPGPLRPSQLLRELEDVAKKNLYENLRELERSGIIRRTAYDGRLPHVEYSLTARGNSLYPIIRALHEWGEKHKKHLSRVLRTRHLVFLENPTRKTKSV